MASETQSVTDLTTIRIVLDAGYDLYAAGLPSDDDDREDFEMAYLGCADHVSEASGVRVDVCCARSDSPAANDHRPSKDDRGIWQAIHDCVYRDEGGSWQWRIGAADDVAEKLARDVADDLADLLADRVKGAVREAVAEAMADESDTLTDRVANILCEQIEG